MTAIRLLPDQISRNWPGIQNAIEKSLPPITFASAERMNNILEALLIGKMQCWAEFQEGKVLGFVVTTITEDHCSKVKNLLIYCVYSVAHLISNETWLQGYNTLRAFALENGCHRIVGYTDSDRIIWLVKAGFDGKGHTDYTFISIDL